MDLNFKGKTARTNSRQSPIECDFKLSRLDPQMDLYLLLSLEKRAWKCC